MAEAAFGQNDPVIPAQTPAAKGKTPSFGAGDPVVSAPAPQPGPAPKPALQPGHTTTMNHPGVWALGPVKVPPDWQKQFVDWGATVPTKLAQSFLGGTADLVGTFDTSAIEGKQAAAWDPIDSWARSAAAHLRSWIPPDQPQSKTMLGKAGDVVVGAAGGFVPGIVEYSMGVPYALMHGAHVAVEQAREQNRPVSMKDVVHYAVTEGLVRKFLGIAGESPWGRVTKALAFGTGAGITDIAEKKGGKESAIDALVSGLIGAILPGDKTDQERMAAAREAYAKGDMKGAMRHLDPLLKKHAKTIEAAARHVSRTIRPDDDDDKGGPPPPPPPPKPPPGSELGPADKEGFDHVWRQKEAEHRARATRDSNGLPVVGPDGLPPHDWNNSLDPTTGKPWDPEMPPPARTARVHKAFPGLRQVPFEPDEPDEPPGGVHVKRTPIGEFPAVISHRRYEKGAVTGTDYKLAKRGNVAAARRIVAKLWSGDAANRVANLVRGKDVELVPVHGEEAEGRNVMAAVYAEELAHRLGVPVNSEVVQTTHNRRTGSNAFYRVGNRVHFDGKVTPGKSYVLVDDHVTQGGSLADLRAYIESQGGKVIGSTTLTASKDSQRLAPDARTIADLRARFPDLEQWWKETYGYGFDALTRSEAKQLAKAETSDEVRDAITQAASERNPGGERAAEREPSAADRAKELAADTRKYRAAVAASRNLQQELAAAQKIALELEAKAGMQTGIGISKADRAAIDALHTVEKIRLKLAGKIALRGTLENRWAKRGVELNPPPETPSAPVEAPTPQKPLIPPPSEGFDYGDPMAAFNNAIEQGRLSDDPQDPLYAGHFMYMGRKDGLDLFKHSVTRQYLSAPWKPTKGQEQRGYHGTGPNEFEEFSNDYIGRGEGSAVQGHGHYVGGLPQTGRLYKQMLGGKLYTVDIDAPGDAWLDFDSPIGAQSAHVQRAILSLPPELLDHLMKVTNGRLRAFTGEEVYGLVARELGSQEAASAALERAGIVGNRYADQYSRNLTRTLLDADEVRQHAERNGDTATAEQLAQSMGQIGQQTAGGPKSHNYVVFDPKRIRVVGKENRSDLPRIGGAYFDTVGPRRELSAGIWADLPKTLSPKEQELAAAVRAIAERMVPEATVIPVRGMRSAQASPTGLTFETVPGFRATIAWALESPDAVGTLRHEAVHWLKGEGFLAPHEWQALRDAAVKGNWVGARRIAERYPDLSHEDQIEEAVAEHFTAWRRGLWVPETLRPIFERLTTFLAHVADHVRQTFGQDTTANDVFSRIYRGEAGRRGGAGGNLGEARAEVPEHMTQRAVRWLLDNSETTQPADLVQAAAMGSEEAFAEMQRLRMPKDILESFGAAVAKGGPDDQFAAALAKGALMRHGGNKEAAAAELQARIAQDEATARDLAKQSRPNAKRGVVALQKAIASHKAALAIVSGPKPAKEQRVYHGSPYDFDAFSDDAIGSGTGMNAHGYGHEFAGRKAVAQHYRDLAGVGKGRLYTVDLAPGEHEWLDYDRPLTDQSPHVQQRLKLAGFPLTEETGGTFYRNLARRFGGGQTASNALKHYGIPGIRYGDFEGRASAALSAHELPKAREKLALAQKAVQVSQRNNLPDVAAREAAVTAAQERVAHLEDVAQGHTSSNYVVFDPHHIKIAAKEQRPDPEHQKAPPLDRREVKRDADASIALRIAQGAHYIAVLKGRMDGWENRFKGMPTAGRIGLMSAYQKGGIDAVPEEWKGFFRDFEAIHHEMAESEHAAGIDYDVRQNYIAGLWEDPEKASAFFASRPGFNKPGFTRQKVFDTYLEGVQAGLKPLSSNPAVIAAWRAEASSRALTRILAIHDMAHDGYAIREKDLEQPLKPGSPLGPRVEGYNGWESLNIGGTRYLVHPDAAKLLDWAFTLDRTALSKLLGLDPQGRTMRAAGSLGHAWMITRNATIPVKLAFSAFHALHVLGIDVAQSITPALTEGLNKRLTLSEFVRHVRDADRKAAYLFGRHLADIHKKPMDELSPDERLELNVMALGGFSPQMPSVYEVRAEENWRRLVNDTVPQLLEEIRGKDMGRFAAAMRLSPAIAQGMLLQLGRLSESIQGPLFRTWIPAIKSAAYMNQAKVEIASHPEWLEGTPEANAQLRQGMRAIAKSIDNRFGEMAYDRTFMPRVIRMGLMGSLLSVGWNYGFLREFGGALADAGWLTPKNAPAFVKPVLRGEVSSRLVYSSVYAFQALAIGGLITWMMTGEPPQNMTDLVYPRLPDGTRRNTMFFTREPLALWDHVAEEGLAPGLWTMFKNKMVQQLTTLDETMQNSDYYGRQIRDPNADPVTQFEQSMAHLTTGILSPISLQSTLSGAEETPATEALALGGFNPAPGYVERPAIQTSILSAFDSTHGQRVTPYAEVEKFDDTHALKRAYKQWLSTHSDDDKQAFDALLGPFMAKYATRLGRHGAYLKNMLRDWQAPAGAIEFRSLDAETQTRILKHASPEERAPYLHYARPEVRKLFEH